MKKLIRNLLHSYFRNKIKFGREGNKLVLSVLNSKFHYSKNIFLGDNVNIGPNADFDAADRINVGNGVIFAPGVIIYTRTHNFNSDDLQAIPYDNICLTAEVNIGDYVWIGRNVLILPGVTIGKGAVVGAGAVVSKDIPEYGIAVGNPVKVIGYRKKEIFDELYNQPNSFVYNKFGRKKIFKKKNGK
ncbi:acyltransferase [Flavobacterium columnare]|uniref:Acyltransferase n=1 Tax=Flavobacterium columnare TaxID=996 RepID=A0AA94JNE7_9FLAO|nr:acyltransferase [Flavobacterium columnare]MCH4829055.1 acyltransferase [Flavobacterium columnare]MCH4833831.1 acyltransferase [Flavobacterium columnare]